MNAKNALGMVGGIISKIIGFAMPKLETVPDEAVEWVKSDEGATALLTATEAFVDSLFVAYRAFKMETTKASIPTLIPFRDDLRLGAHEAMEPDKLFRDGKGVTYRLLDKRFNSLACPKGKEGTSRIVLNSKSMKFAAMAQLATGTITESIGDLSRAIVAQELDITTKQFEDQIIATQGGEDIFRTDGWANLAFTKTGKVLEDEAGLYEEVVVLWADRGTGGNQWIAHAHNLDDLCNWYAGPRLLLRNRNKG